MRFSRDYKILPDYEIADLKHGKTLEDILDESQHLAENLKLFEKTAPPEQLQRALFPIGPRKFQSFHIMSFSLQDAQCSFRAPIGYAAAKRL